MKRFAAGAVLLVVLVASGATRSEGGELSFRTGFHYDWWSRDEGSWGQQILVPYSSECELQDFTLKVLGGYAYTSTRVKLSGRDFLERFTGGRTDPVTSVVSGVVDTKLNLSYDFGERLPFGLLVGLDFNLPTGETKFRDRRDRFLLLDPDLISVTTLGEGLNVNPSLIVTKEWNDHWATGVGFGYAWRGDYDRFLFREILGPGILANPTLNEISPGDVVSVTPEVRYYFNDAWHARLYFNYSHFGPQKVDGEDAFKPGDYYLLGLGMNYERAKWMSHLNLTAIFRGNPDLDQRGAAIIGADILANVNPFAEGDELVADLGAGYSLDDRTTLKSQLQLRYIYDNDPPDSFIQPQVFISDRQLVSLQLGLLRKLIPRLEAEVSVKGLYMGDEETFRRGSFERIQDKEYTGFSTGITLTGTF
ncbi:MAG: hypothetical protein AB9873_19510 [Syntrophobacteraceae bacterium]